MRNGSTRLHLPRKHMHAMLACSAEQHGLHFAGAAGPLKTWRNSTSRSRPSTCSASARLQTAVSSGKTKRGTGLLSQWRQARRLKHRWEKQEGSPGGHSSRLTPCLPRARGRHRPPSTGAALEPKWLRRLSLSLSPSSSLFLP